MADYLLDGEPQTTAVSLNSWGKLLEAVDRRLDGQGRAVSAVRFWGVDQPSFRSEGLARRHIATLGKIEIATSDAAELLAETIAMARRSIPALSGSAAKLAAELRGSDPARASRRLTELVDALRTLTVLTAAIAEVVDVHGTGHHPFRAPGVNAVVTDDVTHDVTDAVGDALHTLIEGQAAHDWMRAADCLDGALAPAIARWPLLFDRLEDRRVAA
jgi:hypothetical protein